MKDLNAQDSHIDIERIFWTTCMNVFTEYIIMIAATLGYGDITEQHINYRIMQKWAAPLPRDREADVQEWAQRAANNLGSIEHLLELTGDVEDIPAMRKQIIAWLTDLAQIEADAAAKAAQKFPPPQPAMSSGGSSTGSKP